MKESFSLIERNFQKSRMSKLKAQLNCEKRNERIDTTTKLERTMEGKTNKRKKEKGDGGKSIEQKQKRSSSSCSNFFLLL